MNQQASNPLEQLRDIHLPEPVSWWPPAPGWWILAILTCLLIVLLAYFILKRHRQNAYRRAAIEQLNTLDQYQADEEYLHAVASLLKQTAISAGFAHAESMQGSKWQSVLEQAMPKDLAELIAIRRYQAPETVQREALKEAASQWIRRHRV